MMTMTTTAFPDIIRKDAYSSSAMNDSYSDLLSNEIDIEKSLNDGTPVVRDAAFSASAAIAKPVGGFFLRSQLRYAEWEEVCCCCSCKIFSHSSLDRKPIDEPWRKNITSGKLKHNYSSNKTRLEQLIPCIADGKVDEIYALLKRSKSPAEDFKKSRMKMIIEKHMFGVGELEQLLSCFLLLNYPQHHAAMGAVAEVWMALFSQPGNPPEIVSNSTSHG